ncbi:hypothetical protein FNH22_10735 [Fulvivirga sp. M361]|uniref:hypothetical protein n=1 Tax=Fulvivirga sp. M361 TaxID=2594266 RepID=UPI001179D7C9|nr:hypothetical protein [Fulvivirga sp. M361]TRX58998.1 hypothetical protein FNH22_10735 [Fulvivirga sp. M361]
MDILDWLEIVILPVVAVVSLLIARHFKRDERILRSLEAVQRVAIRDAKKDQKVRIKGKIREQDDLLVAPISGKKCVAYQIEVSQVISSSYDDVEAELITEKKSVAFYIVDVNGDPAKILSRCQEISLHKELVEEFNRFDELPHTHMKVLEKYGEKATNFLGINKRFIFKEGILEVGERIFVAGKGFWQKPMDDSKPYFIMNGTPEEPMLISDRSTPTL